MNSDMPDEIRIFTEYLVQLVFSVEEINPHKCTYDSHIKLKSQIGYIWSETPGEYTACIDNSAFLVPN